MDFCKSLFCRPKKNLFENRNEKGFASAQWVVLIVFTLLLISTFVNILLIENVRATTLASLRDAARSGAQIVDLKNAVANGDQAVATDECVNRLRVSVAQLSGADTTSAVCTIETNPQGKLFMKASITISNAGIVPWATPFERRLGNLEAIYIPTESR